MISETSDKSALIKAIDEQISQLIDLMSSLNENEVNIVPYEDSWTAGQLFRHIIKSNNGMIKAMLTKGKPAERNAGEKIEELKKTFLDFSHKMNSPEFIVPEKIEYKKQQSIDELTRSFQEFEESSNYAKLTEIVEGLTIGELTKFEILHFVLYHTQRHLHQMKKICDALKNK